MQSEDLVTIIDSLAPINNSFRREKNAIKKVEYVWELGSLLDRYVRQYHLKLDELLLSIYDPHATVKRSNITRSLGSYSSRVFRFFEKKGEIQKTLPNLKSYNIFREALPLLVNEKYIPYVNKGKIITMVNSQDSPHRIVDRLIAIKQSIHPVKNPRTSHATMYIEEKYFLNSIIRYIRDLYKNFDTVSMFNDLQFDLKNVKYRDQLVSILMALASDSFMNKIEIYKPDEINNNLKHLFEIGISTNENRSRFRKWVFSSNELLWLAEAIHALNNDEDFRYFKKKLEK